MSNRHSLAGVLGLAILSLAAQATAQEPGKAPSPREETPAPKTHSPDEGYGEQSLDEVAILPGNDRSEAPVDRRDAIDPFGVQNAVLPSAHVPEKGTTIYSNHLFYGHQLRHTPHERVMLSGLVVFSPRNFGFSAGADSDFFAGASGRIVLKRTRDLTLSMQPGFLFRSGRYPLDTREAGGRLDFLLDYMASDRVVLSAGLNGYLPFWFGFDVEDVSGCADRDEYFLGDCATSNPDSISMPSGGRFLIGSVGATIYALANINFKLEIFSAISGGTILGIENGPYNTDDLDAQIARHRGGNGVMFGPTSGAPIGVNVGTGWSKKGFGVQLSMMWLPVPLSAYQDGFEDERAFNTVPHVFPMSTIGYAF